MDLAVAERSLVMRFGTRPFSPFSQMVPSSAFSAFRRRVLLGIELHLVGDDPGRVVLLPDVRLHQVNPALFEAGGGLSRFVAGDGEGADENGEGSDRTEPHD